MEKYYAFLKENRVKNVAVFSEQNEILAAQIAAENGWDNAIWVEETAPFIHSLWNGVNFEPPTPKYLFEIGVIENYQLDTGEWARP